MRSLTVIKSIIPVMASIQDAGTFSQSIVAAIPGWSEGLLNAACEDRLDLSPAFLAFDAIAAAGDFHAQQDEIANGLALLNQLLDDIPAGKMPTWTPPADDYLTVRRRLATSIDEIAAQYRPDGARLDEIRKDAAMFTGLVKGEIFGGALTPAAEAIAETVYDHIDNAVTADFGLRTKLLERASTMLRKVA